MSYNEELDEYGVEESYNEDFDISKIDGTYSLNSSYLTAKPIKSEECTIDENIIQFHHSFGYDCCTTFFNICAPDDHTVMYISGSYVHMFDVRDGSLSVKRSAGNEGIGHLAKNPVLDHIAIGENGIDPVIIVFEWPTFKIVSVLRGSVKRQYSWLTYSQNGDYLCSQGGEPDYTISVWDWKKSTLILRTRSHTQDVHVCRFSTFIPDHLVTGGSGHIKFWKMAKTFTGLKLQGRLGRFGQTEISDVIGVFSMPDEKVISGCEWGNILVWDEEMVHIQVMRKGKKPCHLAPIIMFLYSEHNAELISVSMDGAIKFWYYRTVDAADPPEKDRVLEMEPSFAITVRDAVGVAKIMGMCKINNKPDSYDYFVQDGNGGIWLVDIEVSAHAKPVKRLAKFHGNAITSLQTSPIGYFIATTSLDGWLHVYDVLGKKLMFTHNFAVPITSSLWLPLKIASSGNIFAIGFRTGILKTVAVPLKETAEGEPSDVVEIQSSKPHTSDISHLAVNRSATVLVCGSHDCSIFVYKIETGPVKLSPIGMYPLPGKCTFVHWKPSERHTALISCDSGHIIEVDIPASRPLYTKESFLLKLESRAIMTASVKSKLVRDEYVSNVERKKNDKLERKKNELRIAQEENPDLEIDEEFYFKDSDEDDEEPPKLYVPPVPNPTVFAVYTPSEKTLWVSVDGYDAGYLYEYDFDAPEPITATKIPDKNDVPLSAITLLGTDPSKMIMGFADGRVRVTRIETDNGFNLNDYIEYSVHNYKSGRVKTLCFSEDGRMLYTCGDDGNIFSFTFQCDYSVVEACHVPATELPELPKLFEENIVKTKEDLKLSLEERKINKRKRKALDLANREKDNVMCLLYELKEKFKQVLTDNKLLPEPLRISHENFQFDERINNSLVEEARFEMDKVKLKLAFDYEKSLLGLKKVKSYFEDRVLTKKFEVKAISKNIGVKTIYHEARDNLFGILVEELLSKKLPKRRIEEMKDPNSERRRKSTVLGKSADNTRKVTESEIFLRNIREIYPTLPKKIQSAIDKFANRIDFENKAILKIKNMCHEKTGGGTFYSEEDAVLKHAWETIGNLNLKTASDFKLSDKHTVSIEDKFIQYTDVQAEIYDLKSNFNKTVIELRQHKIKLLHDYKQFKLDVSAIENELNDPETTTPPDFPEVVTDESIDSDLIDSFEPTNHVDSTHSVLYPENANMPMEELREEPTCLEMTMRQMRKEDLIYKHNVLHKSILEKIQFFDKKLLALRTKRIDVKLSVVFLDLFALTLEEELLTLSDFDLLEDRYSYDVYLKTKTQNEKADQIIHMREDVEYYNAIIESESNKLADIQHTFDMEVRNNDFAKHLRKIFKKKFKTPKAKSDGDDDDDSLSASSSDESDDVDTIFIEDGSGESLTAMGRLAVFDENVLPEGCDPKLFALTFDLRSRRHEIEQSIENAKKRLELSDKSLNVAYTELEVIENELKQNTERLDECRMKKQLKLNDVETTVLLNKSQMGKTKFLSDSILVNENTIQDLTTRVTELKKEIKEMKHTYEAEKLLATQLRTEINEMEHVLKKYKVAVKDELIKKFGVETGWSFIDNMEMDIINCMIIQAKSNIDEKKEFFVAEIESLKNRLRSHQELLTDVLGINTIKLTTLKSLHESITRLQLSMCIQRKNHNNVEDLSLDSVFKTDLVTLNNTYNTLLKQKEDICREINTLKCKGKMFPPIVKQPLPKPQAPDVSLDGRFSTTATAQEDSETPWTMSDEESYNMEFNMEPKKSGSSKQSSRLTKQSSRYNSFENAEEIYRENEWGKYYDDDDDDDDDDDNAPVGGVGDLAKDVFNEIDETLSDSSDGAKDERSDHENVVVEVNDREESNAMTNRNEKSDSEDNA